MLRVRQALQLLGKSGTAFLIALVLFLIFYFAGWNVAIVLDALILLPLGAIVIFRALRLLQRHGLWSVRNRLLFVYSLIGFLPLLLVFALVGLGAWALLDELAIYLASSALNRRLEAMNEAIADLRNYPPQHRALAAPEIEKAFGHEFPGMAFYVRDQNGMSRFPPDSPPFSLAPGWKSTTGLLSWNGKFYAWSHYADDTESISALAPLSDREVENLVPNLGAISIFESGDDKKTGHSVPVSVGALRASDVKNASGEPDFHLTVNDSSEEPGLHRRSVLPPAMSRIDLPILWPSTFPHYHPETPNKRFEAVLWVYSRPSAVMSTFFSGTESLRGALFDALVAIAILFFVVELVALIIGVRLSTRLTGAINALYEGTRRVIFGDFSHRIPVRSKDQLGELSESFNQMTGNLERLVVIEKEKERLQAELEIAREVQAQLYPKEAPPLCGLKLTVQCDPARVVSGDYYDYQEIASGKLAFAIGDVAGKGISAALLMATLQAALRAQLSQHQRVRETNCDTPEVDVAGLVAQLNRQLQAHTSPEKYATFFFGVFDQNTRALTYTNAGHLSPLLFREKDVVPLDSNGTVVGAFAFSKYDESCVSMSPGDLLVCYTDGITEPENAYGEMFGEERLIELVQKYRQRDDHEIIHMVLEAVRAWTGGPELYDDMTLLLAREVQLT